MIKVDIISGFLGAGKTTLVKKLLRLYENEKVILIENEFGDVGIDGDLIQREDFDVVEISTGCICCIMKKDFEDTLYKIIEEYEPERILIEPTGISILSEIIDTLKKPRFTEKCSINTLITLIDAINYLDQKDIFGEFFEDQIINAKKLMLSKSQLVKKEKIEKIIKSLKEMNSEADIIWKNWKEFGVESIEDLLDKKDDINFDDIFYAEYKPCSDNKIETMAVKTENTFTKDKLKDILDKLNNSTKYGKVLRGKGFLKGENNTNIEFSYTNNDFIIYESKFESSGKLCLIGQDLKENQISELFNGMVRIC